MRILYDPNTLTMPRYRVMMTTFDLASPHRLRDDERSHFSKGGPLTPSQKKYVFCSIFPSGKALPVSWSGGIDGSMFHLAPGAPRERSTEAVPSPEEALGKESGTKERNHLYDAFICTCIQYVCVYYYINSILYSIYLFVGRLRQALHVIM